MNQGILSILEKHKESIKIPSLSENIHLLMVKLADDNISYRRLAEVIKNYPEIAARLLFLANSAWSAPVMPITSIEQACSRLGTSVVRSVSIALAVSSHFNTSRCPGFNKVRFWTTGMLAAEGAGLLADKAQLGRRNRDFQQSAQTAGILHNLGLLWLAESYPKETNNALRMVLSTPDLSVSEALFDCVGVDYCAVGGWLGQQWKIPGILTMPMKYHRDQSYCELFWEMVLLIGTAAAMATAINRNSDEIPANMRLAEELGVDSACQQQVYKALVSKSDKIRELAGLLFT